MPVRRTDRDRERQEAQGSGMDGANPGQLDVAQDALRDAALRRDPTRIRNPARRSGRHRRHL